MSYRPTEEAVAHFRAALERDLAWMREAAEQRLEGDEQEGYLRAIRMIEWRTLLNISGGYPQRRKHE